MTWLAAGSSPDSLRTVGVSCCERESQGHWWQGNGRKESVAERCQGSDGTRWPGDNTGGRILISWCPDECWCSGSPSVGAGVVVVLSRWEPSEEWAEPETADRGMEAGVTRRPEAGGELEPRTEMRDPPRLGSEERLSRPGRCGDTGWRGCTCYTTTTTARSADQSQARDGGAVTNGRPAEGGSCQLWSSLWWREPSPERDTQAATASRGNIRGKVCSIHSLRTLSR